MALRECDAVFDLTGCHEELATRYSNVVDLESGYWDSADYHSYYKKIVKKILKQASKGKRVALVSYGHPLLFDAVSLAILNRARKLDIPTTLLPGISCLDTIAIDLQIDFGNGIQIFDAEDLLESRIAINPEIDLLLLQVGTLGVDSPRDADNTNPKRLKPLKRYLREYYAKRREVVIVFSDDGDGTPVKTRTTLTEIHLHNGELIPGASLYIPGTHRQ